MAKNLKLGTSRCECPACGECFNSVGAFDRHRVPVGTDGQKFPRGHRRCLDTLEMLACGMVENTVGYWTTGANPRWSLEENQSGKKEPDSRGGGSRVT